MNFTSDYVVTRDIDWFGLDQNGQIAHFTSGGTMLVPQVLHQENMTMLNKYFRSQSKSCTAKETEGCWTHVGAGIDLRDARARSRFLQDYFILAARGLFSFNVTLDWDVPRYYYRVAEPSVPLPLAQLPSSIRTALEFGFVYPGVYSDTLTISPIELGPLVE